MLNISGIQEGVVLDHIQAGKSMEIYKYLNLDKLDCSVAIIKNAVSQKMGRKDIIKIEGSVELAPILGLSDVIVDIVETGTTLKENNLKVLTEFMPISARFIANKASYKFKYAQLTELLNKMKEALAK